MDGEESPGPGPGPGDEAGPDRERQRIARFTEMLLDDGELNRIRAAEALGRIASPDSVGPLIDTLWDDDARVRLKAAWALGRIGDPAAIPALRRLYRMEKDDPREIIGEAIAAIGRAGSE